MKERAFTLKGALSKQKKFPQSRDILDEVVQNLSALRAAVTDDSELSGAAGPGSEVAKAVEMTRQRERLFESLGLEIEDRGPKPWWKGTGRGLQAMTEWVIERVPTAKWVVHLLNRDWIMATLASAHLTLFAAFGVWVWFTIHHFGDCDSFTGDTRLAILPRVNIRVTSPLRIWFIVLYIICLIPFLNIVLICALELLAILIVRLVPFPRSRRKINLGSFIVLTLLVQVYFIVTTELTIWTNQPLLVDSTQEGDWTFGQTLAVALVAIPLTEVAAQSWKERKAAWVMIKGLVIGLGRLLFQRDGKHYKSGLIHDLFSYPQIPDPNQVHEMTRPT